MLVYRITQAPFSDDLSGQGAYLFGGRWNFKGQHMLYTAGNPSLALLEILAHFQGMKIPTDLVLMVLEVEAASTSSLDIAVLPSDWRQSPPGDSLKRLGSTFLASEHAMMKVPSVVMPVDHNYLINPNHASLRTLKIVSKETFLVEGRLMAV
jgi:RES domain-containing protein